MAGKVLLSFDIEEFDFPREKGENFSVEKGIAVSDEGLQKILKILKKTGVKATFFTTGNFASLKSSSVEQILNDGHEIAAHGVDHFNPKPTDIVEAKQILEKIVGKGKVIGWRQPRMQKIDYEKLRKNGYLYDSSVNPSFIPGRYNNLKTPRRPFIVTKITEIPTSVATCFRIPTFWLALHNFPFWFYKKLAKSSLKKTGYFATYFHPWEYTDLKKYPIVPWYIQRNSGKILERRLTNLIVDLKNDGNEFLTYTDFMNKK